MHYRYTAFTGGQEEKARDEMLLAQCIFSDSEITTHAQGTCHDSGALEHQ